MPMYEYGCLECDKRFDRLRRMDQDDEGVTCPRCQSVNIQRQLSVFAAYTRGGSGSVAEAAPVATGGGGCCGGSCCSGGSRN